MTRYLITSALPYINGVKHLGNLVGSMLPADVYARHLRAMGHEVLYVCATDEHGTPAELAASAAGLDVAEFCRINHELQRDLGEQFGMSWDYFGRTSNQSNHDLTQQLADALEREGFLEERVTRQIYSVADQRFLPDRYIVGTCPHCGDTNARGDQCDNCTKPLDPISLIDPRSAISGSTDLEVRESRHLFLLQSQLTDRLRPWIESKVGEWPTLATAIALKWLDEGLEDRGITRDLDWGIPVNRPGFEGKVFYVWFDAPIGYISATKDWADLADESTGPRDWKSWWLTDCGADDVWYTEFMAKDNVPFHALSFPATLMGSGEAWRLVDQLKSFNWLNYYGGKFSTRDGRGVFMGDALELLPADYWRWYLLSNAPESDDATFTWPLFADAVNKELVGTLGNFVNRCATQIGRHFDDEVPAGGSVGDVERELVSRVADGIDEYRGCLDRLEFRKAAQALRSVWSEGNVYLEAHEPWRQIKTDRDAAALTLRTAAGLIRLFSHLSSAFIPTSAVALASVLPGVPELAGLDRSLADTILDVAPGTPFVNPGLLFTKIDDEMLATWSERFGT